jgi:RNase P subunit RPR2
MKGFLLLLGCVVFLWILLSFLLRKKKAAPIKECLVCGAESKYGYSEHAEEVKKIISLCQKCLITELEKDYIAFSGRAVVIQPAPGPPCYVFHSNKEWGEFFKESRIDDDARAFLLRMDTTCQECGEKANFLWIGSSGLTAQNFGNVLKKGFSETLLPSNPKPISLCGKCCVRHIARELEEKGITYLEVCSPKGTEDGFVIPMAY